jgi:hypothetical protein
VFAMRNSFLYFRFAQMRRSQPRFAMTPFSTMLKISPLWLHEANAMLINGTSQDQRRTMTLSDAPYAQQTERPRG